MNITVSFDQALNSLPAGFATAVNAAVSFFNTTFSDSVSLTLHVGFGEVNGGAIDPSSLGRSYYSMHQ